jgi:hypothetical protein
MSNFPNMSYCQCENTLAALQQVLNSMREEGHMFVHDMTQEERRAYRELFAACEDFLTASEELEDEMDGEDDGQPSEAQEWHDFDPDC